jgi:hypothetical protein
LGDFLANVKEEATEAFHIQEKSIKSQISELSEEIDAALPQKVKEDASNIFKYIGGIIFETEDEDEGKPAILKTEFIDIAFDSAFLTSDHTIDSKWVEFKQLDSSKLLNVHKQTILANDSNLKELHQETVPNFVSENAFWEHWSYYNFLKKNPKKKPAASLNKEKDSDWGSWDIEEASVLSSPKEAPALLKEEVKIEDNTAAADWDEWN